MIMRRYFFFFSLSRVNRVECFRHEIKYNMKIMNGKTVYRRSTILNINREIITKSDV